MKDLEIEDIQLVAELPYKWDKLSNKTLLISGASGFIGSFICNVIEYRNKVYHQNIKIISLTRRGGIETNTITHKKIDISQPFIIREKIDYVLHLASNTHPAQYADDPIGTITTNIFGCDNLLKIAKDNNARFLLASSVEIYGNGDAKPMDEKYCGYIDCNSARSGYNESKRVCESLAQAYKLKYDVDVVIARLARVFGADRKKDTKAMAQFIDKIVEGNDIVLKSKGLQRFSYCYIADAASGIIEILLSGNNGEAYNIAADDDGLTLGDYAGYLARKSDKNVIFQIEDNQSVSKSIYALLDTSKLKLLGWKPLFSIKEGLERTLRIKSINN